jgi:hypothetical protein
MSRLPALFLVLAAALSASADCIVPLWRPGSLLQMPAQFVTTADLDGENGPDVIGNDASSISISLNDGTGAFPAADGVYTGTIRGAVVVADATGDAKPDLVFAGASSLVVVPGNGNGTFGAAIETPVTIAPHGVATAFLDAGLTLDLVTFDPALTTAVVYTGTGAGGFTEKLRLALRPKALTVNVADLDADGWQDVLAAYSDVAAFDVFYGTGNATFGSGTIVSGVVPFSIRGADLDKNALPDLVAGQNGAVSILRNLGSRRFGDPLTYRASSLAYEVLAGDLTGDSIPDVVVPGPFCGFTTLTGTGTGTLQFTYPHMDNVCGTYSVNDIASGDFDGDGRMDLVLGKYGDFGMPARIAVYRNACGDVDVMSTALPPLISVGQSATLNFKYNTLSAGSSRYIQPTGTVTLRRGDTVAGTATFGGVTELTFTVPSLPVGEHAFVADYAGDRQYEPKTSAPVNVRVTSETTTTTITMTPSPAVYGSMPSFKVDVTSSIGSTPTGLIRTQFDHGYSPQLNAPTDTAWGGYQLGPHTFTAKYDGDAQHPPSTATLNYTVVKQTPPIAMTPTFAPAGQAQAVRVDVKNAFEQNEPDDPTGNVTLRVGDAAGTTKALGLYYPYTNFEIPALPVGRYSIRISYAGDVNYNAAETIIPYNVFDPAAQTVDARGTAQGVTVTWSAPATQIIQRRLPAEAFKSVRCCGDPPWLDQPAPETVFIYRTVAYSNQSLASAPDVAMRIAFTDDTLLPGMKIRAVHMQELVRAANILRAAAGLPLLPTTGLTPGNVLTAARVNQLRTAINEARSAFGAPAFPFAGTIAPGSQVRASHLQELREAIR